MHAAIQAGIEFHRPKLASVTVVDGAGHYVSVLDCYARSYHIDDCNSCP
jgi:hypothetical protein